MHVIYFCPSHQPPPGRRNKTEKNRCSPLSHFDLFFIMTSSNLPCMLSWRLFMALASCPDCIPSTIDTKQWTKWTLSCLKLVLLSKAWPSNVGVRPAIARNGICVSGMATPGWCTAAYTRSPFWTVPSTFTLTMPITQIVSVAPSRNI